MTELTKLKELIEGKIIVFCTSSKNGKPNAVLVEGNKLSGNKIVFTNNCLNKSLKNLKQNNNVALVVQSEKKHFQVKGTATHHADGEWFDFVKNHPANKGWTTKGAVVVLIKQVFDLESGKQVL